VAKTMSTVVTSTNADDMSAKPAPGPMYARAGAALIKIRQTVHVSVSQGVGRRKRVSAFGPL